MIEFIKRSKSDLAVFICVLILLFIISLNAIFFPLFSPDSWSYFYLSKTVFGDFYKVSHSGNYIQALNVGHHAGYPPFYPIMIALVNKIFNFGIYGGIAVNFVVLFLTLYVLCNISRALFGRRVYALVFLGLLMLNFDYYHEFIAARSIPLAILLQLALLYVAIRKTELSPLDFFVMGMLGGLTFLTRFDFIAASFAIGVFIFFMNKKAPIFYYLGLLLFLSPWVYYSYSNFGVLFASDNKRTAIAVEANTLLHYFPTTDMFKSIFTHPHEWLITKFRFLTATIDGLVKRVYRDGVVVLMLFFSLIFIFLRKVKISEILNSPRLIMVGFTLICVIAVVLSSGYPDTRYFTSSIFYVLLIMFFYIERALSNNNLYIIDEDDNSFKRRITTNMLMAFVLAFGTFIYALPTLKYNAKELFNNRSNLKYLISKQGDISAYEGFVNFVRKVNPQNDLVIVTYDVIPDYFPLMAQTDLNILRPPTNFADIDWNKFQNDFKFKYIYTTYSHLLSKISSYIELEATEYPNLWKAKDVNQSVILPSEGKD